MAVSSAATDANVMPTIPAPFPPAVCQSITRRSGELYGSRVKSTAFPTLKIAAQAPILNAITAITAKEKPGLLRIIRRACLRSLVIWLGGMSRHLFLQTKKIGQLGPLFLPVPNQETEERHGTQPDNVDGNGAKQEPGK
jgi:hypothetical protein